LVEGRADHVAQPEARPVEAQDQGDGQPLLLHHDVLLAGEVLRPRRLPASRARDQRALARGSGAFRARAPMSRTGSSELGADLSAGYRLRFGVAAEYRTRVWRVLIDDWFARLVKQSDVVLDLGSGWGEFINQVAARERYALDLNPDAETRLASGVKLLRADAAEPWPLADASLDCVFTSNFLEHLPDKAAVMRALGEARRCLRPGGRLICLGPNIRVLHGRYWDFFDHHTPLSDLSL